VLPPLGQPAAVGTKGEEHRGLAEWRILRGWRRERKVQGGDMDVFLRAIDPAEADTFGEVIVQELTLCRPRYSPHASF
jgi:hypothetical protein